MDLGREDLLRKDERKDMTRAEELLHRMWPLDEASATFQHRHYNRIASIIAALPEQHREAVAQHFSRELSGTNPNYSSDRFYNAAVGKPRTQRDIHR